MLSVLKVLLSLAVIGVVGYFAMPHLEDYVTLDWDSLSFENVGNAKEEAAASVREEESVESVSDVLDQFLAQIDSRSEGLALGDFERADLEDLFIEATAAAYDDRRALEVARASLQQIARQDPAAAVSLLYAVAPFLKETLAVGMVEGWTRVDPLSAWDWVESAWIDDEGAFVDRALQNKLSMASMSALLDSSSDLVLAATLTSLSNQPDLKEGLAELVGEFVVSEDPELALTQFEFEGDQTVDVAIMNAVIKQWAERDLEGAVEWAGENEDQLAVDSMRELTKQLVLVGETDRLQEVYSSVNDLEKRDAVAAEAARLLVRREIVEASRWLSEIGDPASKRVAVESALYELGYDDLDSTIVLVHLAFESGDPDRSDVLVSELDKWVQQDRAAVARFLASGQEASLPPSVEEFVFMRQSGSL